MPKGEVESEVEIVLDEEMDKIFTEFGLSGEQRIKIREILREWDNLVYNNPQKIKIALQKLEELKCSSEENRKAIEVLFHITHIYAIKKYFAQLNLKTC